MYNERSKLKDKYMNLVKLVEERLVVSTLDIAKRFNKAHKSILLAIRNIKCSEEFSRNNFIPSTYTKRGKVYPYYLLTRDGFSFLVMGFTGEEADQWKEKYINAFNQMEKNLKALINKNNQQWQIERTNGIQVRLSFTDTIAKFVEYARAQGSSNAGYYYSNITQMIYKALGFEYKKGIRDHLSPMELSFLQTAENICGLVLENNMNSNAKYKDIYTEAKTKMFTYGSLLSNYKPQIESKKQALLV